MPRSSSTLSPSTLCSQRDCCLGIDEAGRGCLAGPVVAAAVAFAQDFSFATFLPDLTDSKKLTPKRRDALASCIRDKALVFGFGIAWQNEIDQVNILNATFRAMSRAVLDIAAKLEAGDAAEKQEPLLPLVIDGNKTIPQAAWQAGFFLPSSTGGPWEDCFPESPQLPSRLPSLPSQQAVVDGDLLIPAVSAASILAKTSRDILMTRLDALFPGYGFARHKGYGTKAHLAGLAQLGPCPLHRETFRGVRPEQKQYPLF